MGTYIIDDEDCVCCDSTLDDCQDCRKLFKTCLGAHWGALIKELRKDAEVSFDGFVDDPDGGCVPGLSVFSDTFIIPGPFTITRSDPQFPCTIRGSIPVEYCVGAATASVGFILGIWTPSFAGVPVFNATTFITISGGLGGSSIYFSSAPFGHPCTDGCPSLDLITETPSGDQTSTLAFI